MINIVIENAYGKILDSISKDCEHDLIKECSYFVKGAQFTTQYQKGIWDGRKKLYDAFNQTFPVGLYGIVKDIISKYDSEIYLQDNRIKPIKMFDLELKQVYDKRKYQDDAVEKAVKAQRGVLVCPTGSGKTIIALRIAQILGVRTLFIVNKKEAVYDTVNRAIEAFGKDVVGQYGANKKEFGSFITIATMSMLISKIRRGDNSFLENNFQCLFIDEVHHVGADTWFKVCLSVDAYYKYGLTGTPFRSDGGSKLLRAATGKKIVDIKTKFLQEKGFLVKSKIYFIKINEPKSLDRPLQYFDLYYHGIVKNDFRNNIICKIVEKELGNSILITVDRIEHGKILLNKILKIDDNALFIEGKSKNRENLKMRFENGELKTIIATDIYNESVDIPILEVIINASGGESGVKVAQRIGRSLRINRNKQEARCYDFFDTFNVKMEKHSMERIKCVKKYEHKLFYLNEDLKDVTNDLYN